MHIFSLLWVLALPAHAACESIVKSASSLQRHLVAPTYAKLIDCDAKIAKSQFNDFLKAGGDTVTISELAMVAIERDLYSPVWGMFEEFSDYIDYSQRKDIATVIGAACTDSNKVLPFLQGAYFGLGTRQFDQWRPAFEACGSEALTQWMGKTASSPPNTAYDNKYGNLCEIYVDRLNRESLPFLETAMRQAVQNGGPVRDLIEKMADALRPQEFGATLGEDELNLLGDSLVSIATEAPPEAARLIADGLHQMGRTDAALQLLPSIYADRIRSDGSMLYGVSSIEECSGQAVVHWAVVTEYGQNWSLFGILDDRARAFKPRLKCTPEGPWPVMTTPEPMATKANIEAWANEFANERQSSGLVVTSREEKSFSLKP